MSRKSWRSWPTFLQISVLLRGLLNIENDCISVGRLDDFCSFSVYIIIYIRFLYISCLDTSDRLYFGSTLTYHVCSRVMGSFSHLRYKAEGERCLPEFHLSACENLIPSTDQLVKMTAQGDIIFETTECRPYRPRYQPEQSCTSREKTVHGVFQRVRNDAILTKLDKLTVIRLMSHLMISKDLQSEPG